VGIEVRFYPAIGGMGSDFFIDPATGGDSARKAQKGRVFR